MLSEKNYDELNEAQKKVLILVVVEYALWVDYIKIEDYCKLS